MAQIGEKIKLLTDSTKADLNQYFNTETLVYFRNMIDHDYDNINRKVFNLPPLPIGPILLSVLLPILYGFGVIFIP